MNYLEGPLSGPFLISKGVQIMPLSTCSKCHKLIPMGDSRCEAHKPKRRHNLSASARGYGKGHRALRNAWAPIIAQGLTPCVRCKGLIRPADAWDLGHEDTDRATYAGPEHARCNRATQTKGRATARPTK